MKLKAIAETERSNAKIPKDSKPKLTIMNRENSISHEALNMVNIKKGDERNSRFTLSLKILIIFTKNKFAY